MAEQKLTAEKREDAGKGVARKLRAGGRVPAVLYGHGMDPVSLSVDARDLHNVLHTGAGTNVLVDLMVDGKKHLALPREIQQDLIRGKLVHVDFLVIRRDEKIVIDVPLREVGVSPGVKEGGVVEHHMFELHVECLPTNVPEAIEVDISDIELNGSVRVGDLSPPEGVTILSDADEMVLAVVVPAILKTEAELEEEAAAEAAELEEAAEGEAAEGEGAAPAEGESSGEGGEG